MVNIDLLPLCQPPIIRTRKTLWQIQMLIKQINKPPQLVLYWVVRTQMTIMKIKALIKLILAKAITIKLHHQQTRTTTIKTPIRIIIIVTKIRIKILSLTNNITNNLVMTLQMITQMVCLFNLTLFYINLNSN